MIVLLIFISFMPSLRGFVDVVPAEHVMTHIHRLIMTVPVYFEAIYAPS